MVYGYARVSTRKQARDGNSLKEQEKKILEIYPQAKIIKEAYSGAKERRIFDKLINTVEKGDTVIVTKLDRFCRTTKEGLEYIDALRDKGVRIHILNMGIIENNPIGNMIITNLLAFAEFERAMIIERTQAGKEMARDNPNFVEGRPRKFTKEQVKLALELLEKHTYSEVEGMTGISKSTLIRRKREKEMVTDKIIG